MESNDDSLERLAEAGVEVFGTSDHVQKRRYRPGDFLFYGGVLGILVLRFGHLHYGWGIAIMLVAGFALNELEKRSVI